MGSLNYHGQHGSFAGPEEVHEVCSFSAEDGLRGDVQGSSHPIKTAGEVDDTTLLAISLLKSPSNGLRVIVGPIPCGAKASHIQNTGRPLKRFLDLNGQVTRPGRGATEAVRHPDLITALGKILRQSRLGTVRTAFVDVEKDSLVGVCFCEGYTWLAGLRFGPAEVRS